MHAFTHRATLVAAAMLLAAGGCSDRQESTAMANPRESNQRNERREASGRLAGRPANAQDATFAAGCFWGVEDAFRATEGVTATEVGYTGGEAPEPTYEQVCAGGTGHAEAVRVEFDPAVISYEQLVERFFAIHDPTQLNRQGPDYGAQYRSAIFYHDDAQRTTAEALRDRLGESGRFKRAIVTQIAPAKEFYRAEEYHQQYREKTGTATCRVR